ncbi:MAG: SusF/SusE family outer membrane protein [Muribaculaceae bacterium]|nr:SusF/SusE family outer membrane protein [Muribaculaceae bacterium]
MNIRTIIFAVAAIIGCFAVNAASSVTSDLSVNISTDKAMYSPSDAVTFTIDNLPTGVKVRYRHLDNVVSEEVLTSKTWTWQAPSKDFTGYMVDVYKADAEGNETILGSIAVDVSSDWTQFPRYGFVADYGSSKSSGVVATEMDWLCRCHINGVQFYDWHYKHHWPLGGTREKPLYSYTDIANRTIYTSVVKNYINAQHSRGMKSMFYNLCYGALDDAAADGVQETWYAFTDQNHTTKDVHVLNGWKSNIYLLDPSNTGWQAYIAQHNDDVYANFDFDGYHIDQLGYRGNWYNYSGKNIQVMDAFGSFVNAMKTAHPAKHLVMNAVGGYGQEQIAKTGNVDFLYNELWENQGDFSNLRDIIATNNNFSGNKLKTVFAAYVNRNLSGTDGYVNTPGVLLTDAAMFALGGTHLEIGGDHILTNEYFPTASRKMSDELKTSITHYYDFLTAYENVLRDGGIENTPDITSTTHNVAAWSPQTGKIITYCKQVGGREIVHLLNFINANSTSWRDADGTMPEAAEQTAIALRIGHSTTVEKVWVASPDYNGGVPQQLEFTQTGGVVSVTVPALKYWDMLVIEDAITDKLMVVGEATWGGWSYDNAALMHNTSEAPHAFTYTGWMEANKDFKFLCQAAWDDQYNNGGATILDGTGKLVLNDKVNDTKFQLATSGNYTIVCNLDSLTVTATKAEYQAKKILHDELFIVGSATPGGWDLTKSLLLTQNASNPFEFSGKHLQLSAGTFKIAVNNRAGYGQKMYYRNTSDNTKITEDSSGDNQWSISGTAEYGYDVTVNLDDMTISISKASGIKSAEMDNLKITKISDRSFMVTGAEGRTIKIYSVTGQVASEVNMAAASQTIDMNGNSAGIYIMRIDNLSRKIVLQ